jgi:hypothetical protein
MFLIDIPFKGCQGRSNHSSIVHAVSYFACGVNDTACIFNFFAYHSCFEYDFHFSKLFRKNFRTTLKSENHVQSKNNDTACILNIRTTKYEKALAP